MLKSAGRRRETVSVTRPRDAGPVAVTLPRTAARTAVAARGTAALPGPRSAEVGGGQAISSVSTRVSIRL
jgi:hypothetical protein